MLAFTVTSMVLLGGVVSALRGHGESHFCYSCHHISDPLSCHTVEKCWPEGHCGAEAVNVDGEVKFNLGCFDAHKCTHNVAGLIGRRSRGHHEEIKCAQCCNVENCNRGLCSKYNSHLIQQHTTHAKVTHETTSTSPRVSCRDHVEDGFSCDMFDKNTICMDFDPSSADYFISHTKCPNYCGFCDAQGNFLHKTTTELVTDVPVTDLTTVVLQKDTTTQLPITTTTVVRDSTITEATTKVLPSVVTATTAKVPCLNHEDNGFLCGNFDLFNFCTDHASFAYPLALEKCQLHCGFCSDAGSSSGD